MTALAADTDLEARLGRALTSAEDAKVTALLDDASALIRAYTRQEFTEVTSDVVTLRPVGTRIRLPQTPVTAVNSVTAIGWGGVTNLLLPTGTWGFDGIDIIEISPLNSDIWLTLPTIDVGDGYADTYEVDYDHGDDTVPADVVAVCCGMVLRVLTSPSLVEGMSSERIGQYSYQMSQQVNGGAAGVSVRLTEQDKDLLGRYRRKATTVQLELR